MSHFIVEFPLKTEKFQQDILNKRFEIGRKIYNNLAREMIVQYNEMTRTIAYRDAYSKKDFKEINQLRKLNGFSEYGIQARVKKYQHYFTKHIDSNTSQKIATQLWKAFQKLFYGNGKKIHFKRFGEFDSFEGKSNKTGIRFKEGIFLWNGLNIPISIDENNMYEKESLISKISYCRVVRKFIRNKYKFYIQIVFKGLPPAKRDKNTGFFKQIIGSGDVGIDIGTQTVAISSSKQVMLLELANRVQKIENEKRLLLRKMDRSKRATNPMNFNDDRTIKAGRLKWQFSKKYTKQKSTLKELYRKQKDIRKYQHECLANEILSLGDKFYVEKMSFSGLAKRTKLTEENTNKRKKRFGKSIANKAPAMFLDILNRKLTYHGSTLTKINTVKARASQFNHLDGSYKKKKLSQRWNNFNDFKIQRDLYSAFLLMNINDDLETFNKEKTTKTFKSFIKMHDLEVARLQGLKNISSMCI